ncbi:MAG: dUTP diphosphatase [Minisyncoccia bacterium]|jgi:dUTP pyrophosphatase
MNIKIVRVDKDLPLPEYHTEGAVAFDLYCREDATVAPRELAMLPSNFIIQVPDGYALIIAARSGLAKKKSLALRNGIGIIDQDYHGPEDEIKILVHNFTDSPVAVTRGERLAQGLIVPIVKATWEEVSSIKDDSRGGFGATG